MAGPIKVGVIGANADKGWASLTHLPAIDVLDAFELTAVCTTRQESADAAAARYGAKHGLTDAAVLVALPDVDLVVVSVRAPSHYANVRLAVDAGKHVLCEWPLGIDTAESMVLFERARLRGVRHFVGLQGYASPAMVHARDRIANGYVGELLSASMYGALGGWGPATPAGSEYIFRAENGVTVASIPGGHAVDMLCTLVGELVSVSGLTLNRRPQIVVRDGITIFDKTSPDQFLFTAQTEAGVPVSVHIEGGVREKDLFTINVRGTEGTLRLDVDSLPEILPPALFGTRQSGSNLEPITVPSDCRTVPQQVTGAAINVAQLYQDIAADISNQTWVAPDFGRALARRVLIDAVALSGIEGRRIAIHNKEATP